MRLLGAAKRFDRLTLTDAYSGGVVGKCQFDLYDDSRRDGMTTERRIVSVAPDVSMPSRRVITSINRQWLVGDFSPDYYGNEAIRHKYIVHESLGLASIKTMAQALAGSVGTNAYFALSWVKGAKQIDVSSQIFDVFEAFFSRSETVKPKNLINYGSDWYIVRSAHVSEGGLLSAVVDKLEDPVFETVGFVTRTYVPITDSYTTSSVSLTALRVRWQEHFEYLSKSSETYLRGDLQVMIPRSATPKVNDALTLSDGSWLIMSVTDEDTYWSLHLRRA